jgi:hypothetical protein
MYERELRLLLGRISCNVEIVDPHVARALPGVNVQEDGIEIGLVFVDSWAELHAQDVDLPGQEAWDSA